jgi:alpha-galactosidase
MHNRKASLIFVVVVAIASVSAGLAQSTEANDRSPLAITPPMGWNSWDGYGTTINEADFRANADWFAKRLKPAGWQYLVIDMEWFVTNPVAEGNSKTFQYSMDLYGRYVPPVSRFPSAANDAGFKPLADYVHSLGLKFGIHILRGIPKQAVAANSPIAGSDYHAAEAADTSDACPWNFDNYGVSEKKPGGQAYYDSIAQLYAGWGVDLIKVDCISYGPYKGDEIRMLSAALHKTGRPIILSLSPGPAPIEKAAEMAKYAQMWRISNDIWDMWHNAKKYPQGVGDQFAKVAQWESLSTPGHWPDADMLPVGHLGPAPGWGKARDTKLTRDEQRTLLTLWSVFHSPLMIGGDLTRADEWTTALLTNPEVIAVDQNLTDSRLVSKTNKTVVWSSKSTTANGYYVAVFNIAPTAQRLHFGWKDLGLPATAYQIRDLWEHHDLGSAPALNLKLPPHACSLYRLSSP